MILSDFLLREIGEMFGYRMDKPFGRKTPVVDFAASFDEAHQVLGQKISLRENFEVVVRD